MEKVRKLVEENPVLFNKEAIKKVEEEEKGAELDHTKLYFFPDTTANCIYPTE